jgi:hypothetical protein
LFFLGPRFAFLIYWLIPYGRLKIATAFNTWFWPLLELIFLPWTTLMYTIVYGGSIYSFDWLWLGLALLAGVIGVLVGLAMLTRGVTTAWVREDVLFSL